MVAVAKQTAKREIVNLTLRAPRVDIDDADNLINLVADVDGSVPSRNDILCKAIRRGLRVLEEECRAKKRR